MTSVIALSIVMLNVGFFIVMLSATIFYCYTECLLCSVSILNVVMLSVTMLNVAFVTFYCNAENRVFYCYAEYHYAESNYTKCRYEECRYASVVAPPMKANSYYLPLKKCLQ